MTAFFNPTNETCSRAALVDYFGGTYVQHPICCEFHNSDNAHAEENAKRAAVRLAEAKATRAAAKVAATNQPEADEPQVELHPTGQADQLESTEVEDEVMSDNESDEDIMVFPPLTKDEKTVAKQRLLKWRTRIAMNFPLPAQLPAATIMPLSTACTPSLTPRKSHLQSPKDGRWSSNSRSRYWNWSG